MSDEQNAPDSEMPPEIEALHPFILEVCAHLIPGTEGERYWISAEDAIDIHAGLLEYEGDDELAEARSCSSIDLWLQAGSTLRKAQGRLAHRDSSLQVS